ncbi:type II secretion system secretin GspD [Ideonella oryzae]|uniref:Type IV pilus biogenesis and competence protein PilQ n=1 Tax=Ideonella oryzae TaxID=2937441 RepID=A0ABT1BL47_9BURK|nr:type II secretion system secretin GspD [Ideonella oryzae]MCO5976930.1 type II secretion system secretin GspD [Ideonella oryzae]
MSSLNHHAPRGPVAAPQPRLKPLAFILSLSLAAPLSGRAAGDDPPMPATRARAPVTLNFVDADVDAVSRAIGTMLDRQIVVDPRVRGKITVTSEKPQPPLEAWRSYLAALRGLGFTVVENAGLLKVVPEAEAKLQAGTVTVGTPTAHGDQVVTQIFRLNHENPNNLVAVLRPLISANNTINANPSNGTLVITDYADNLQRLGKIIAALDQPAASEIEIVPVRYAMASDLAPLIQKLSDVAASNAPGAAAVGQSGSATTIMVEPRTNALVIRAANPTRMAATKALIDKLDRPVPGGGPAGNIWVVYLKNADAVRLAEVLRAAMASGAAAASGSGGSTAGTGGLTGAGGSSTRPTATATNPGSLGNSNGSGATSALSSASTTPVSATASVSTGGQIQADPATNSLIISAPEPVYRQMRQVIDQLDTRRAQVYVETMIVKVDAAKAAQFGVQWQGILGSTSNNTIGYVGTNYGSTGNIANLTLAQFTGTSTSSSSSSSASTAASLNQGINIGILNKINGAFTLGALANFLQTQTGANVLSTPNLVALDNEEAKIVIGSNVPFVTGSYTNTGGSSNSVNPFQTVERKDVGIVLRIKSQIGEGGTIRMTVYQENSTLRSDGSSITDKSSIETSVVVDDGQTMVLGGLLKDEYGDADNKVPLLGSIPLVGRLFSSDNRTRTKTDLMLFLRPVIIRDNASMDKLVVDRYDAIRAVQQNAQPEKDILLPVDSAPVLPARQPGQKVPAAPLVTQPFDAPQAPADSASAPATTN